MREDRVETLRDDLGLELERLIAIEPSPELRVRVHARIAREDRRTWWLPRWQTIGIGAAAAAVAAMIVMARVDVAQLPPLPATPTPQASMALTPRAERHAPVEERRTTSRPAAAPRAPRHSAVPRPVPVKVIPLEPLAEIAIEPVAIEPLGLLPPLSGERQ